MFFSSKQRLTPQTGYILDPGLDAVVLTFSALPNLRCLIISKGLVTALYKAIERAYVIQKHFFTIGAKIHARSLAIFHCQ